jgi:hypothetical protein
VAQHIHKPGLKISWELEARLLNNAFMENHTLDQVKAFARRFDNKKRSDLFATRLSVLLSFTKGHLVLPI